MINTEKHYLCVENYQRIMKIALIGYGKMGKEIEKIALSRGHEIVSISYEIGRAVQQECRD